MNRFARYARSEDGSSAVEFALIVLPLIGVVMGVIVLSTLMYFNATLQHAVEDSARWASVTTVASNGTPPTAAAVESHFNTRYVGPSVDQFTYASAASEANCSSGAGAQTFHRVYAHAVFQLDAVLVSVPVGMSASACFP